jgi:hypothetical protein
MIQSLALNSKSREQLPAPQLHLQIGSFVSVESVFDRAFADSDPSSREYFFLKIAVT